MKAADRPAVFCVSYVVVPELQGQSNWACGVCAITMGDDITANAANTVPTSIPAFNLLSCLLVMRRLYARMHLFTSGHKMKNFM